MIRAITNINNILIPCKIVEIYFCLFFFIFFAEGFCRMKKSRIFAPAKPKGTIAPELSNNQNWRHSSVGRAKD